MKRIFTLFLLTTIISEISSQNSQEITPLMKCAACKAIVKLSLEKLSGRRSEMHVTDSLEYICLASNFSNFEFPPPYMAMACEKVIRSSYDDIEDALIMRESDDLLDRRICVDQLKICTGNMDVSLENKDLEKGEDGRFDVEKLRETMAQRGGSVKVAGGSHVDEDLLKGFEEQMGQAAFIEDI